MFKYLLLAFVVGVLLDHFGISKYLWKIKCDLCNDLSDLDDLDDFEDEEDEEDDDEKPKKKKKNR